MLFSPFMGDFTKISSDLLEKDTALVCHDEHDIVYIIKNSLLNIF
jgi:hypothetical protein